MAWLKQPLSIKEKKRKEKENILTHFAFSGNAKKILSFAITLKYIHDSKRAKVL